MVSWAIKFAQSLDKVTIVLSSMNRLDHIKDNMIQIEKLSEDELSAIWRVIDVILDESDIPCTACGIVLVDVHRKYK